MGFKDDFSSMVNRGASAASRKARQVSLNSKANELRRQRQTLVAQLGASLYEQVKGDPILLAGRENLISQIEALDNQRREIELEQRRLQTETEDAQVRATVIHCAVCGSPIRATDQFCSTCGATAEQAMPDLRQPTPVLTGPTCPSCGASISADDVFCMNCGARIEGVGDNHALPSDDSEKQIPVEAVVETVTASTYETPSQSATVSAYDFDAYEEDSSDTEATVDDFTLTDTEDVVPKPVETRPVTNEELESEIESAIAEELNIEDMVEELKDEISSEKADDASPLDEVVQRCPDCGQPVIPGDLFCQNCGRRLEDSQPPAPIPSPAPVRYCQNCGAPIEDDFKFCGNCGQPV